MDKKAIISALDKLTSRGMDFGLERERKLLDALSSPDKKLKIIHIAGSNGKGSVAEYITRILTAAGKRTGTFTSPAVYDYFETVRIDGKPIDDGLFERAFGQALDVCGNCTRFEVETAAALYAFELAGCEYAVVECGLGGLYDATNAVANKEIAIITSISLEHTAILGGSIKDICRHKAGIIKNCPAVVSGCVKGEAREYFEDLGATFADGDTEYGFNLNGACQRYNAATAVAAARLLGIEEKFIREGIEKATLLGRLERIDANGTTYILDGAHNEEAFTPLAEYLKNFKDIKIIYGCLSDKDADGCLKKLEGLALSVTAVKPESPRAMPLEKIEAACKRHFKEVDTAQTVSGALDKIKARTVVVCGTFTLLKEAKSWIEKRL
ncbi:MAG: hypothetical protein K2K80_08445 [Clostridia bacterium]|nr:hypothetical protein [Clostridia bacterium]